MAPGAGKRVPANFKSKADSTAYGLRLFLFSTSGTSGFVAVEVAKFHRKVRVHPASYFSFARLSRLSSGFDFELRSLHPGHGAAATTWKEQTRTGYTDARMCFPRWFNLVYSFSVRNMLHEGIHKRVGPSSLNSCIPNFRPHSAYSSTATCHPHYVLRLLLVLLHLQMLGKVLMNHGPS